MIWVLVLLFAAGTLMSLDRAGTFLVAVMTSVLVVFPVIFAILWVNDHSGATNLLESSLTWLAGVDSMGEIYPKEGCPPGTQSTAWSLLGILVVLINSLGGLVAVVCIPAGVVLLILGLWPFLVYRDTMLLEWGLWSLILGVGGVIVAGLGFRLLNWMYADLICAPL